MKLNGRLLKMDKPSRDLNKTAQAEEATPPRNPLPPTYPSLVKITGERLVNALNKIYQQGGSSEH